jgi:NDP-sugar pyrophosphorylase family protein
VPKPLIKIKNIPLIDHCIKSLRDGGIQQIYVTYGYKSELLVSHIEKKVEGLINTSGKDNSYFLFNTIIKNINENIIILPCDIIIDIDFKKLYENCKTTSKAFIVPVEYIDGMNADFIKIEHKNRISQIGRHIPNITQCASGIQVCNPYHINKNILECDNWYSVWSELIAKNMLYSSELIATSWKTYDKLEQLIQK